ncbi:MAG: hypothetical protein C0601_01625 [Candidatus Muiribacterium halophilum]|uniref:Alpha-2-macroglobulin domain-containing protein n=1 Tax=Muiribacterium halophilum TaxID=2053465 RepID=A0A2N5ZLS4_MUIH1|nr:MAG: hypothetical protein C0601_01625 [Candidatus Muirbacterium halophilum]
MNHRKFLYLIFILFLIIFNIKPLSAVLEMKDIIDLSIQGEIKADSEFGIKFKKNINKNILKSSFFKLTPNTPVMTKIIDNNTLIFVPDETLYPDKDYNLQVDLKKLFPTENFKNNVYKVNFKTKKRQLVVTNKEELERDNSSFYSLKITIRSDVPFQYGAVNKSDIVLLKDNKNRSFFKNIDKLEKRDKKLIIYTGRIEKATAEAIPIKLHIKNKNMGIEPDWDYDFIVPMYQYLDVTSYKAGISEGANRIEIDFNRSLKQHGQKNLIEVTQDVKYLTTIFNKRITLIGDFLPGKKYKVKISKLLEAKNGEHLKDDRTLDVVFENIKPEIRFENEGIYLPMNNKKSISFQTMNVSYVKVRLERLFANNLTYFLYENSLRSDNKYYYGMYKYGETVFEKRLSTKAKLNVWKDTEIDISKYIKNQQGILYKINILFSDSQEKMSMSSRYSYGQIEKVIIPTDLGMCCKKTKDGSYIFVFDIKDNKPAKGVKLSLYDDKNQLIDWGMTDEDGLYISRYKDFLYATANSDKKGVSFIKPQDSVLEYSSFGLVNKVENKENTAYIFTDRDVYRPGDEINVGLIFRNRYGSFPSDHPIRIKIKDTMSKLVEDKVLKNSKDGFYFYTFKTSELAPTGVWNMHINTGQTEIDHRIRIETIVPTKLEVKIKDVGKNIRPGSQKDVYRISSYLTGKPATELKSSLSAKIFSTRRFFEKLSNYDFYDETKKIVSFSMSDINYLSKTDNGYKYSINIPENISKELPLKCELIAKVFEDNGRDTSDSISFSIKGKGLYSGILRSEFNYLETGKKQKTSVVLVNSEGEFVPGHKLRYRILRNESYWWWHYSSKREFRKHFMSSDDLVMEKEGTIVSSSSPVDISFTPSTRGEYLILIDSPEDAFYSTSSFFSAFDWGKQMSDKDSFYLKITPKKDSYFGGDIAKVLFDAPFSGKALLTIEGKGIIYKERWIDVKKGRNIAQLAISKNMFPNVFVFISFLPEYKKDIDIPSRIFGICEIKIMDDKRKLNYSLICPDEVQPGEKVRIEIDTKEKIQSQLVLNIADEGLLLITDYTSPDPERYFYKKNSIGVETSDIFNRFIQPTDGNSVNSLSIGGGESLDLRKKNINRIASQRFTPVQISSGLIQTDINGKASFEFTMPDYEGSVRVSLAGARGQRYGSSRKNIKVIRDISIFPSMPRFLYVKDKTIIPIRLINNIEKDLQIKFDVISDGRSEVYTEQKKEFTLKKEKVLDVKVNAADEKEDLNLIISIKYNGKIIKRNFELVIIDPAPYMMIKEYNTLKKSEIFNVQNRISDNSYIEISTIDSLELFSNLKSLVDYQYGCLEQTVSKALPQLYIDGTFIEDDTLREKANQNVTLAIKRLKYFQKSSGEFAYWPGGGYYLEFANLYAGLFLNLAKEKGFYVDSNMFSRWLSNEVNKSREQKGNVFEKTFRLYVLSSIGKDVLSEANYMIQNDKEKLRDLSLLLLINTYKNLGQKDMIENLMSENISKMTIFRDGYSNLGLTDLSMILELYIDLGYKDKALKVFRQMILSQRLRERRSTLDRALVIKSTLKYLNTFKDKYLNLSLTYKNGNRKKINKEKILKIALDKNSDLLEIKNESEDDISVAIYSSKRREDEKEISNGLFIQREFRDENGLIVDPEQIKSSEEFYMTVSIKNLTGSLQKNILLQQKISGCWEFLQDDYQKADPMVKKSSGFDHMDKRDDSITWFFDLAGNKKKHFSIKLRCINKGEYTLPGSFAQNMYSSDIFYKGKTDKINIKE